MSIQYPQEDYDTAAIIVIDDTLWAFSKRSLGSSTALYRLPVDTIRLVPPTSPLLLVAPP